MEQAERKPQSGGTTNNYFYGPIGQYIEHVEHNHFGMDTDGTMTAGAKGDSREALQQKLFPDLPPQQVMTRAVAETLMEGYWWSNRSWAIVYRCYQMKGYLGGISNFVKEVGRWDIQTSWVCNYDAVQKPIAEGTIVGPLEKWEANGAQRQAVVLAAALLEKIERMMKEETKEKEK